ncbi:unnamed protein product, partial [Amoebophrya sp. A25]
LNKHRSRHGGYRNRRNAVMLATAPEYSTMLRPDFGVHYQDHKHAEIHRMAAMGNLPTLCDAPQEQGELFRNSLLQLEDAASRSCDTTCARATVTALLEQLHEGVPG